MGGRRGRGARHVAALIATLTAVLVLSGCGAVLPGSASAARVPASDLALIRAYVDAFNAAGGAGPEVQTSFLRATQEPGTPPPRDGCLGRVTLQTRLVDRTLRPDLDWTAPDVRGTPRRPAGAVYVVATAVDASQDGVSVREDVGSKHLVVRDGRVFGYAPCPG